MEIVGAGLGNHVDRAPGVASALGTRGSLRRKFHYRIDREYGTSNARDTALIDRRDVVPEVVVVHAVNLPIDLIGAGGGSRARTPHAIPPRTRGPRNQMQEVTPIQWDVLHHVPGRRPC